MWKGWNRMWIKVELLMSYESRVDPRKRITSKVINRGEKFVRPYYFVIIMATIIVILLLQPHHILIVIINKDFII